MTAPPRDPSRRVLVVGEVLWDLFPDAARLGGAALNVAAHLQRLGHTPRLVSAVGADALGRDTRAALAALDLDCAFVQSSDRFDTGRAHVRAGPGDETAFTIERPAAYDAVALSDADVRTLAAWRPEWLYYGTLFPSLEPSKAVLRRLLDALPQAVRVYDLNLRPGFESRALVHELLHDADVVKLNEREFAFAHRQLDLPFDLERFCRDGAARYGWRAAAVTLGARGCAVFAGSDFAVAPGVPVQGGDPVGAGDAFTAALVHGLASGWAAADISAFANRAGAYVASQAGAIPEGTTRSPLHL